MRRLENLPEFEEGANSTLEPHNFIKGMYPCDTCDLPYMIATSEGRADYCKRISIYVAKKNGTFNPNYNDDPSKDHFKVLKTLQRWRPKK